MEEKKIAVSFTVPDLRYLMWTLDSNSGYFKKSVNAERIYQIISTALAESEVQSQAETKEG